MGLKVTSILLNIKEEDFELYEEELIHRGWSKIGDRPVFRKMIDETEVEIKEHIPTFSADVYLTVTARNENGIKNQTVYRILDELRDADKTED